MKKMRKFMALLIATIMMASNIAPAFADSSITEEPIPSEDIINKFVFKWLMGHFFSTASRKNAS